MNTPSSIPVPTSKPSPLSSTVKATEINDNDNDNAPTNAPTDTSQATSSSQTETQIPDRMVDTPLSLLVNIKNLITITNSRGVYRPEELKSIGFIYESVNTIINNEVEAARENTVKSV